MFKSHPLLDQGFNHISLITAPFRLVRRFGCGSLLVLVLSLLSARPADAQNTLTIDCQFQHWTYPAWCLRMAVRAGGG